MNIRDTLQQPKIFTSFIAMVAVKRNHKQRWENYIGNHRTNRNKSKQRERGPVALRIVEGFGGLRVSSGSRFERRQRDGVFAGRDEVRQGKA